MTESNTLTLFVNYKDIPGALLCRWIDRRGLGFKIPRSQFRKETLDKFPESGYDTFRDKACVYILFGENMEGDAEAYIGQSISIDSRIGYHASPAKTWNWSEAFVFCRNDLEFEISHMKYVEEQLILKARGCRIPLRNDDRFQRKGATCDIKPAYKKAADDFIEGVVLLCSALGYKLFEPLPTADEVSQPLTDAAQPEQGSPTFTARTSDKYKATGRFTGDGKTFMVIAGSTMSQDETPTIPGSAKEQREELQASGIVKNCRFVKDYVFRSAGAAAYVINGGSISAKNLWEGLEEFLDKQEQE